MKLNQLINLLQRYHDLYPNTDPEVIMTAIDYSYYDRETKKNPEYNSHTVDVKMFEARTLVYLPEEKLFSEREPYLNIFYELEYIDKAEDFWKLTCPHQHEQTESGSPHPRSCPPATDGIELGGESVPPEA